MAAYRHSTGIIPFGPHRDFADRLIGPRLKPCKECKGRGLLDTGNDGEWQACPRCQGAGFLFKGKPEVFESLRERIIEAYPGIWNPNASMLDQELIPDQPGEILITPNGKHPNVGKVIKARRVRSGSKKQAGLKSRVSKPISRPVRKRAGM
jgi:hypothetical protein